MFKRVSKEQLDEFVSGCVAHTTTTADTFGTYDAIVWDAQGQAFRVNTKALDPTAEATIETITDDQANAQLRLIAQEFNLC